MRCCGTIALAVLLGAAGLQAQDSHYWTLQFGPRSSMLGGVVIGSVSDVSATYYNPGALGTSEQLSFAISALVFETARTKLESGGGRGVDVGTSRSGLRPSLIAGVITRRLFGGTLAYSALTRLNASQELQGHVILSGSELPPEVLLDDLATQAKWTGDFSDNWLGLSYGHRLGDHLGLGLTWYGAFRNQWRRHQQTVQTIQPDGTGSVSFDTDYGAISTIRTLAKVGLSASVGRFSGGLTFTTPSLQISGKGQFIQDSGIYGIDTTALAATVQPDLKATYKSPLSVGAGLGVRIKRTQLHFAAEWYGAVAPYVVIQVEPFVAQQPEELIEQAPVQELGAVLNWGIALDHTFSSKVSGYLAFYTDRSALSDDIEEAALSVALPMDIRTVTLGSDLDAGFARFTFGVAYGWGSAIDQELTDLMRQVDEDYQAKFVYRNLRLVFGFEL
jgi:hypothetical protein